MAWFTVVLEVLAPVTIWMPRFRTATLVAVILLHVGMEVTLNMHLFEALTILGWCSFLVQPDNDTTRNPPLRVKNQPPQPQEPKERMIWALPPTIPSHPPTTWDFGPGNRSTNPWMTVNHDDLS